VVKPAREFVGTERFTCFDVWVREAHGRRYEAHDRKMDKVVALKNFGRGPKRAHLSLQTRVSLARRCFPSKSRNSVRIDV